MDGGGRFLTRAREFVPAYLETWESGRLREKIDRYPLVPDCPDAARQVIRAMHEQVGELRVNRMPCRPRSAVLDCRAAFGHYVNVMDQ